MCISTTALHCNIANSTQLWKSMVLRLNKTYGKINEKNPIAINRLKNCWRKIPIKLKVFFNNPCSVTWTS